MTRSHFKLHLLGALMTCALSFNLFAQTESSVEGMGCPDVQPMKDNHMFKNLKFWAAGGKAFEIGGYKVTFDGAQTEDGKSIGAGNILENAMADITFVGQKGNQCMYRGTAEKNFGPITMTLTVVENADLSRENKMHDDAQKYGVCPEALKNPWAEVGHAQLSARKNRAYALTQGETKQLRNTQKQDVWLTFVKPESIPEENKRTPYDADKFLLSLEFVSKKDGTEGKTICRYRAKDGSEYDVNVWVPTEEEKAQKKVRGVAH